VHDHMRMMMVGTLNSERLRNKIYHQQNVCVNKQLSVVVVSIINSIIVVVRIVKIVMAIMNLVKIGMAVMNIVNLMNIMTITSLLYVQNLYTSNLIINPVTKCL